MHIFLKFKKKPVFGPFIYHTIQNQRPKSPSEITILVEKYSHIKEKYARVLHIKLLIAR